VAGAHKFSGMRNIGRSTGFKPVVLVLPNDRSYSIDGQERSVPWHHRQGVASLGYIGRVRLIVSAYRDHGLEARATQGTLFSRLPESLGRPTVRKGKFL